MIALNSHFYWGRILAIGSQYDNRKFQDIKILLRQHSFKLKFFQSYHKIWQTYCRANLSSVLDPLKCWLSITVLAQDLLSNYVTTLFAVSTLWRAWGLSFSSKCLKFHVNFKNTEKNWELIFNFRNSWIWIGCEKNSLSSRQNTYHRESIY